MSACLIPDLATGSTVEPVTSFFWLVCRVPLYCVKPVPTSLLADSLNDLPDTTKLAGTAPLATPAMSPTATTTGAIATTAKRRQLVRPYAGAPCASFTDPPSDG